MHARTVLVLLVVLGALGGLVLWSQRQEAREEQATETALLPELDRASVSAVRVDNLERGLQLRVERGDDGVWRITDPLEYTADGALMELLLDALVLNRWEAWEGSPEDLQLAPPRVVVEVEQAVGNERRVRRLEVGAIDLDPNYVYVRSEGRLGRTLRNLDNALERDLPDWRTRALLGLSPTSIVEVHRRGRLAPAPGAEPLDMTLDAVQDDGWVATQPFGATLAPERMGAFLTSLAYLRVAGFEDDAPGPLELYGLEPPDLRLEFTTAQGQVRALRLTDLPRSDRLRAYLEGDPHVYQVARETVGWLTAPAELLVDDELVRARRDRVERVRLAADGRETTLERKGFAWYVSSSGGAGGDLPRTRADGNLVSDLIGRLEDARLLEVLPGLAMPATLVAQGLWVEADGEVQGGSIGPAHRSERGTDGLLFRREGDTLVTLVDPALLELARTDPRSLRSAELHRVGELEVAKVYVLAAESGRPPSVWTRGEGGRWTPEGSQSESREFARLVDRLLNARAERFFEPDEQPSGESPLAVALLDPLGKVLVEYKLALLEGDADAPGDARVLYTSVEQRAVVGGELYFGLRELLGLP